MPQAGPALTFDSKQRILVLAPHTDDGELGCGGSIVRFLDEGHEVHYAACSICEESVPEGWPRDILDVEVRRATAVLGIPPAQLRVQRFRVRRFPEQRQEILEDLVRLNRELTPQVVFLPSLEDVHQDHQVLAREGLRAFRTSTLLCYEMPWNCMRFATQAFVRLEARHVERKVAALAEYASQRHRPYASPDVVRSLARLRGLSSGAEWAEAFEVLRWVI